MQRIERYGVIALVILLVTILAVSLWGESGWNWKFWEKQEGKADVASVDAPRPRRNLRQNQDGQAQNPGQLPMQTPVPSPNAPMLRPEGGAAQPVEGAVAGGATQPVSQPINPVVGGGLPTPQGNALPSANNGMTNAPLTTPVNNPALNPAANPGQPATQHPILRGVEPQKRDVQRQYVVRAGDTLGSIAARELGASSRWTEIQALNGNIDPKKVRAGMNLTLPGGKSVAADDAPKSAPKNNAKVATASQKRYTVKSGDTLSKIAARELGDGDRWNEIVALNPGLDPNKLKVGAALTLPAGTVAQVERKDDDGVKVGWSPRAGKKTAVQ